MYLDSTVTGIEISEREATIRIATARTALSRRAIVCEGQQDSGWTIEWNGKAELEWMWKGPENRVVWRKRGSRVAFDGLNSQGPLRFKM